MYHCRTWSWATVEDASRRKSYLPPDKQCLQTKNGETDACSATSSATSRRSDSLVSVAASKVLGLRLGSKDSFLNDSLMKVAACKLPKRQKNNCPYFG